MSVPYEWGGSAGASSRGDVKRRFAHGSGARVTGRGARGSYLGTPVRGRPKPVAAEPMQTAAGRDKRFLVGLGVGARRPLGASRGGGPLSGPIVDPRLQFGFGF